MLKLFAYFIAFLPFPVLYWVSDLLAWLTRKTYRRKLVTQNIRSCFPEFSEDQVRLVRKDFYRNLTDVSLEVFKTLRMGREEFNKRVRIKKNEAFEEIRNQNGPFLLFASHQCNWEWLGHAVAVQLVPLDSIYKELHSKNGDRLMKLIRARFGNRLIPAQTAGKVLRNNMEHRGGGILADQTPTRRNKGKTWARFLGRDTPFYKGIFALPFLTQHPCYYIDMIRISRGKYEAKISKLAQPPFEKNDYSILESYIKHSESTIQANPSDWLWSHNRWKYARVENEELINFH